MNRSNLKKAFKTAAITNGIASVIAATFVNRPELLPISWAVITAVSTAKNYMKYETEKKNSRIPAQSTHNKTSSLENFPANSATELYDLDKPLITHKNQETLPLRRLDDSENNWQNELIPDDYNGKTQESIQGWKKLEDWMNANNRDEPLQTPLPPPAEKPWDDRDLV